LILEHMAVLITEFLILKIQIIRGCHIHYTLRNLLTH
jgi:hypothetical protein